LSRKNFMRSHAPSGSGTAASYLPVPSLATLLKEAFLQPMSTAMAFAVVVFAAGSVVGMSALASAEIGGGLDSLPVAHVSQARSMSQVLGDSTTVPASIIEDSSLESAVSLTTAKLSAKAVSFDPTTGRWNYTVLYSVSELSGTGSITIGTYVVTSGLTANSGKVDTGAILKPSTKYQAAFWVTDGSGNRSVVARLEIKTGKGKTPKEGVMFLINPCLQSQGSSTPMSGMPPFGQKDRPFGSSTPVTFQQGNASSTPGLMFCLENKEGKTICPKPPVCAGLLQGGKGDRMGQSHEPFGQGGGQSGSASSTLPNQPPH
jgi:hypothetical protein